ncbi:2-hydroxy-6-oxononadienedioate/2-hydroxy-6-oxononatrienedioate hydrolase [Serratia plymuthica]|uniref:alpha/beta fold hydrolase n=1 Tax=Serratia plymuthica TaxID=82996 RepID=UPI00034D4842|nr:alpha/beta hydrolase [Serratia plymuthica]QJW56463.1 2-hydroxy-6-oxononadienedioate/2-hydroxy-6-oxononatrienedioate hydrolase [Serratia plymuthica]
MKAKTVHGAALPYTVIGEGRPAVLLVHGFLDGASIWFDVATRLNEAGIAVAAVDLPGMGGSDAEPDQISLDAYAQAVASVVDALAGEIVLVGQSMGAQVAELVAQHRPDAIKGLVLLTPVPLAGVGASDDAVAPFRSAGGQADVLRGQRQALSHQLSDDALESLAKLGLQVRPDVVARLVDVWNSGHAAGRSPSTFAGPVLVIRGASDPFVTNDMATAIADRFQHSKLETVADAGHWAHVERPAEVAAQVRGVVEALGLAGVTDDTTAADWRAAFSQKSRTAFGQVLSADVIFEAVALLKPVHGRENAQRVLEAGSQVYKSLTFTNQTMAGNKQYVEWVAEAHEGVKFDGITILTRDESGAIAHIAIHHRPMEAAIFFSRKMGRTLNEVLGPGYFLEEETTQGDAV